MSTSTETKELSVLKQEVATVLESARDIVVKSDEDVEAAGKLRLTIKEVGKRIQAVKDSIVKPMNESLKATRAFFAGPESMYEEAETLVNTAIIKYQNEQESIRRKAEAEANKKLEDARIALEKGKITEAAFNKVEVKVEQKLEAVPVVVKKTETFHTRVIKQVRITDEKLIPREYLVPDMVKINKVVKAGVLVPGCELYEEKTLV